MSGMKILCVENQPEDLAILTSMLEGIGYEVTPATTGGEALSLFTREAIDGVLLEYNLPDKTGTDLRAQLKRMQPDVPVLLLEGVGSQTPRMVRSFDACLRHGEPYEDEDSPGEVES